MYAKFISTLTENAFLFLIYALGIAFCAHVLPEAASLGVQLVLYGHLAFYCHRITLTGETYSFRSWGDKRGLQSYAIKPFVWRYLALSFVLVALVFGASLLTLSINPALTIFGGLSAVPIYGIVLALIGTVLPAASIEEDASLGAAWRRGKLTFWRTVLRLTLGYGVLLSIAVLLIASLVPSLSGIGIPETIIPHLVALSSAYVSCCVVLLTAMALSFAYQEAEAIQPTAGDPHGRS
ncbi:MAG: hypothetical protein AAGA28_04070 [Pseudomonadota bacterium]